MRLNLIAAVICALSLAGCAAQPELMAPKPAPRITYATPDHDKSPAVLAPSVNEEKPLAGRGLPPVLDRPAVTQGVPPAAVPSVAVAKPKPTKAECTARADTMKWRTLMGGPVVIRRALFVKNCMAGRV